MAITYQGRWYFRMVPLLIAGLLLVPAARAEGGSILLAEFTVTFSDLTPEPRYVVDVGYDVDPRTPYDDEWIFGRGDDGSGSWVLDRVSPVSYSAFSNADDANFDAVVARLTDGINEQFSLDFWRFFGGYCCASEFRAGLRRPESDWLDVAGLAGASVGEIRLDWVPSPPGIVGLSGTEIGRATVSLLAIPEPSTAVLLGLGFLVLAAFRRRYSGLRLLNGARALRGRWSRRPLRCSRSAAPRMPEFLSARSGQR